MRSPAPGSSVVLALAFCACGGAAQKVTSAPTPDPPKAVASAAPAAADAPSAAAHTLPRSAVVALVAQGLGYFLQRVELDDHPVFVGGKFHGFRIASLRDPQFWSGVDLKPGDVVTGVNGFPIERPEQAQTAFESLEVASELRVDYERDGKGRALVYGIVDDR
jgi:type II secretory pathway component PulC